MLSTKTNLSIPFRGFSVAATVESNTFSWAKELGNFFSPKVFNMLLWPVFKMRQRYINQSAIFKLCMPLPGFSNLWNTIQKGSFAYNTLFLRTISIKRSSSCTDLADVTTLVLFFADEFIDGIRLSAGKDLILKLLDNDTNRFYLGKKIEDRTIELEYSFDLFTLLPSQVMEEVNPKYKINYETFYYLLKYFLHYLNQQLAQFPFEKGQVVADKIIDACNTCFDSYLHDINAYPEQDSTLDIATLIQYHELKTRCMQRKLLELRCFLADREDAMHSIQLQSWINIMSVVQLYDDMQDIAIDDGFQDNLVLCIARRYFQSEWNWFRKNIDLLKAKKNNAFLISLNMPSTIQFSLQMAADKIKTMNWEQQKIMHYLLKKNWFVANQNQAITFYPKDELSGIYKCIKNKMQHLTDTAIKSYAIDVCFHKCHARKQLLRKVNITNAYQLRYNLLSMSIESKAAIFNAVIKK